MIFVLYLFNTKYHKHIYKILMLIDSDNVSLYNKNWHLKIVEQKKIILEMETIKSDLRMVTNLIERTNISRTFLESNIKTIERVKRIQN